MCVETVLKQNIPIAFLCFYCDLVVVLLIQHTDSPYSVWPSFSLSNVHLLCASATTGAFGSKAAAGAGTEEEAGTAAARGAGETATGATAADAQEQGERQRE